jgi:hypothetical protein
MLRLAYPGELRATLVHGQARYDLMDLSQEGARIVVGAARDAYEVGRRCHVVLCLVSRTILSAEADVTRVTAGEVAFQFRDLHFPFSVMLDEHCAVLTFQDGLRGAAVPPSKNAIASGP